MSLIILADVLGIALQTGAAIAGAVSKSACHERRNALQPFALSTASAGPAIVSRIAQHDVTRKGVAAALAGILVAVVSESLWPSS